ncbi:MAG: SMC-Scp complex subunit ScpB [Candidatus Pacebacteria bacterium]|nr:SMC-Scp complex subunit ScpB [Candidatus Paceibacterota bacterium]
MKTSALIEALLFSRAEPWTHGELVKALGKDREEIMGALTELENDLQNRGIHLLRADDTVTLGTHPDAHVVLEQLYKEELSKGLSKASVETLSIIMYGDEVTRGKIDYIRGVNSGFILRSLLVRGLIERKVYPRDRKRFMYVPTVALLASLGAEKVEQLPEYEKTHAALTKAAQGSELAESVNDENTSEPALN